MLCENFVITRIVGNKLTSIVKFFYLSFPISFLHVWYKQLCILPKIKSLKPEDDYGYNQHKKIFWVTFFSTKILILVHIKICVIVQRIKRFNGKNANQRQNSICERFSKFLINNLNFCKPNEKLMLMNQNTLESLFNFITAKN